MTGETLNAVQPEKILKELEALWIELGNAEPDQRNAVLRACAMTFLVALEQDEDAQAAGQTLAELMHEHPSRAIVLRIDARPGDQLEARVFAQCWMPFGRRQQICCEQIEISASTTRLEEVPPIVMGVMAPDLPVVLWCHSARLYSDARFQRIFPLADKLIIDSTTFAEPRAGLDFVRELSRQRTVADLAWTRLTRWREMIALLFDEEESLALLPRVARARIVHRGVSTPVAAHYMAGWLRHTLPSPAEVSFAGSSDGTGEIAGLSLTGQGIEVSIELDGAWAILRRNDLVHRAAFLPRSECELLREELSILGRDPVFEKSLR